MSDLEDRTVKIPIKAWAVAITALTGIAGLHAKFIMPAVLRETAVQTDKLIESHAKMPHADAMTKNDMLLLMERISPLATKMDVTALKSDVQHLKEDLSVVRTEVKELRNK